MFSYKNFSFPRKREAQSEPFLRFQSDDSILEDVEHYLRPEPRRRSKVGSYLIVAIITSVIWLAIFFIKDNILFPGKTLRHDYNYYHTSATTDYRDTHNITTGARLIGCGNSTQEAQALGCQYDVLLNHWVPGPCIDHDYLEEYMDDNSWLAYKDEALTQPMSSIEEMYESEFYFTSLRDHINHCAMLWKKQFWVLYKEYSAFDTIIANPHHTDHCAFFLTEARDVDLNQATRVEKGYAGCWIRD